MMSLSLALFRGVGSPGLDQAFFLVEPDGPGTDVQFVCNLGYGAVGHVLPVFGHGLSLFRVKQKLNVYVNCKKIFVNKKFFSLDGEGFIFRVGHRVRKSAIYGIKNQYGLGELLPRSNPRQPLYPVRRKQQHGQY